jgi:hypothetical protein
MPKASAVRTCQGSFAATVYPRPETKRTIENLRTSGFRLPVMSAAEKFRFIAAIVDALDTDKPVDITGYRFEQRITITTVL